MRILNESTLSYSTHKKNVFFGIFIINNKKKISISFALFYASEIMCVYGTVHVLM